MAKTGDPLIFAPNVYFIINIIIMILYIVATPALRKNSAAQPFLHATCQKGKPMERRKLKKSRASEARERLID